MPENLTKEIESLLLQIHAFDEQDVDHVLKAAKEISEEGKIKLIKALREGLETQAKMMKQWMSNNPEFTNSLRNFVKNQQKEATSVFEKTEQLEAEHVLDNL